MVKIEVPITVKMDFDEIVNTLKEYDFVEVVRCKNCKWFGKSGCAIEIVDDSDKPKEDDYCSFAERKDDEEHP